MICSRCKKNFEDRKYKTCANCRSYNKFVRDQTPRTFKQGVFSTKDNKTKQCAKCFNIKSLQEFYKHKRYKDGYRNLCKGCHSIEWKNYYNSKYKKVLTEKVITDHIYKLKQNVKSYIHIQLKNRHLIKSKSTLKYVGCDIGFLYRYLCYTCNQYGNENYHIDHVIPLSLFDLNQESDIQIAFHWTNLQVLPKKENLKKYNNFSLLEYCNHLLSVYIFVSKTTKNYEFLKKNLQYAKNICNTSKLREVP